MHYEWLSSTCSVTTIRRRLTGHPAGADESALSPSEPARKVRICRLRGRLAGCTDPWRRSGPGHRALQPSKIAAILQAKGQDFANQRLSLFRPGSSLRLKVLQNSPKPFQLPGRFSVVAVAALMPCEQDLSAPMSSNDVLWADVGKARVSTGHTCTLNGVKVANPCECCDIGPKKAVLARSLIYFPAGILTPRCLSTWSCL